MPQSQPYVRDNRWMCPVCKGHEGVHSDGCIYFGVPVPPPDAPDDAGEADDTAYPSGPSRDDYGSLD
jgi:hypothetical protein